MRCMSRGSSCRLTFERHDERKKKARTLRSGLSAVLAAVSGCRQPRSPRESHPRKLPTAAHSYSQNGSRITSISSEPLPVMMITGGQDSWPCQAVAGLASRTTVGRGLEKRHHVATGTRRPENPLLPAAGLFAPRTPSRERLSSDLIGVRTDRPAEMTRAQASQTPE